MTWKLAGFRRDLVAAINAGVGGSFLDMAALESATGGPATLELNVVMLPAESSGLVGSERVV